MPGLTFSPQTGSTGCDAASGDAPIGIFEWSMGAAWDGFRPSVGFEAGAAPIGIFEWSMGATGAGFPLVVGAALIGIFA